MWNSLIHDIKFVRVQLEQLNQDVSQLLKSKHLDQYDLEKMTLHLYE